MHRSKLILAAMAGLLALHLSAGATRAESPAQLSEIIVSAPVSSDAARGDIVIPVPDAPSATINAAELASQVPGVDASHRGANAAEPVIRGLGWERVTTQSGCHPLYGACPSRMDPPATYVPPSALQSVVVVKSLPSVTLGPGATGGKLILVTDYDRGANAGTGYVGHAEATWNEGRGGFIAGAAVEGGTDDLDVRATADVTQLGDYTSAGGVEVPANLDEQSVSLSLGWRPTDASRLFGGVQYKDEQDVEFPALPMDIRSSESTVLTLGYRSEEEGGLFERFEINAGYSYVDHLMNNEDKSNRMMMEAETPSEATTVSGKVDADWRASEDVLVTLGIDAEHLERDATRTRTMVASGMSFTDHIWPDAERDVLGLFGEANWDASDTWTIRTGLRLDTASADANAADDTIVLGPGNSATIRERYVEFNGPDAADVSRDEILVSGNLLAEWSDGDWTAHAGIGHTERFPAVTELYFAFSPAPGGYQIGNPALDPEKKNEAVAGVGYESESFRGEVSVFAARVDDYILLTSLSKTDLNSDGKPDNLRGFRNVDAELYGGELKAEFVLTDSLSVPLSLAYTLGKNTTDDRDLPEIPPLSGTAAVRYDAGTARPWWIETGLRFAAKQDKVDVAFPEDETPSFTVAHIRAGVQVTDNFGLEAGVENLFDEDYNEHLTREVALATDDLAAGDEVPAPGRYVYVKGLLTF